MSKLIDNFFFVSEWNGKLWFIKTEDQFFLQKFKFSQEKEFVNSSTNVFILVFRVNIRLKCLTGSKTSLQVHIVTIIVLDCLINFFTINWIPIFICWIFCFKIRLYFSYFFINLFQCLLEWGFIKLFFIHLSNPVAFLIFALFISKEITKVIIFGSCSSCYCFFNQSSSDFLFKIIFLWMSETDSEKFNQLKLTFYFEFLYKWHK